MFKPFTAAACALLLVSCVNTSLNDPPISNPPIATPAPQLPDVAIVPLPDEVATAVKTAYANEEQVPENQVNILRFSRETWTDGCLGLGGPAESCLLALTEGWQVEATNATEENSLFYRTDLSGEQIRLSTLENYLPPSVGDRILQTLRASGMAMGNELSVVEAEPQVWDGCFGVAKAEDICAAIAIFGWRAIVTDGQNNWTYHTDNLATTTVLNPTSDTPAPTVPPAMEPPDEVSVPNHLLSLTR